MSNKIIQGDCLEELKNLPDESVDCCVTSPPYWALRDYGVDGQLGLEPTFQEYITKLCDIFDEVKRVLKKEGTCWVNMGDTYANGGKGKVGTDPKYPNKEIPKIPPNRLNGKNYRNNGKAYRGYITGYPSKSLCQISSRFAIEMTNRGWILRNEIIWYKPNCMPSSVKDRFTVDFEKVFFFVKNKKYWFEQQLEPFMESGLERVKHKFNKTKGDIQSAVKVSGMLSFQSKVLSGEITGRNKRCVWKVSTKSFHEAHFATYPEALIEPMIKAGCPVGGVVLDPFFGAGTTGLVALKQNKHYLGIELNPEYIEISNRRLYGQ